MAPDTWTRNLEDSIKEAVQIQLRKAEFPKFQLERAIDGFLGPFLGEFISLHYDGAPTRLLSAEFPIRKSSVGEDTTFQTTNVDYAYLVSIPNRPTVAFVELKTDPVSFRMDQLDIYYKILGLKFEDLLKGIADVLGETKRKDKYGYLDKQICQTLEDASLTASDVVGLDLLYLTPHLPDKTKEFDKRIIWVSFDEFIDKLDGNTRHPELWKAVRPLFDLIAARRP